MFVLLPNTVVQPRTVVIKSRDTILTRVTVSHSKRLVKLANSAVAFKLNQFCFYRFIFLQLWVFRKTITYSVLTFKLFMNFISIIFLSIDLAGWWLYFITCHRDRYIFFYSFILWNSLSLFILLYIFALFLLVNCIEIDFFHRPWVYLCLKWCLKVFSAQHLSEISNCCFCSINNVFCAGV